MSNVAMLSDATRAREDGRASRSSSAANPSAWVRPGLVALTAVCALVLLGRFVAEPLMLIHHVVVHSDVPLSDDQVLSLSGIKSGEHWYTVSVVDLQRKLETSPLVRRALVQKVFPDTIRMTVWGRQPAALVLASADGRSVPVLVDADGVVFKVGTNGAELDLPVVSGLAAGDMALGAALPRMYRGLFADLRALHDRAPALYAALSEVKVVTPGPSGAASGSAMPQDLELLVFLTASRVPIRARGSLDEGFVKYALMVIDLLSRQGVLHDIQELDFRSGDVVYKLAGRAAAPAAARSTDGGSGAVPARGTVPARPAAPADAAAAPSAG